jgi:hypothetical protein
MSPLNVAIGVLLIVAGVAFVLFRKPVASFLLRFNSFGTRTDAPRTSQERLTLVLGLFLFAFGLSYFFVNS